MQALFFFFGVEEIEEIHGIQPWRRPSRAPVPKPAIAELSRSSSPVLRVDLTNSRAPVNSVSESIQNNTDILQSISIAIKQKPFLAAKACLWSPCIFLRIFFYTHNSWKLEDYWDKCTSPRNHQRFLKMQLSAWKTKKKMLRYVYIKIKASSHE